MLIMRAVFHGLAMSCVLSVILLGSIWYNPRIWLRTYPRDVKQAVPPKTREEKRVSLLFQIPFMLIMIAVPVGSSVAQRRMLGPLFSFWDAALTVVVILMVFDLVDLLVIDWLVFCYLTPEFIVIPGTSKMAGYKDYRMHAKAFVKGTAMILILGPLLALISLGTG